MTETVSTRPLSRYSRMRASESSGSGMFCSMSAAPSTSSTAQATPARGDVDLVDAVVLVVVVVIMRTSIRHCSWRPVVARLAARDTLRVLFRVLGPLEAIDGDHVLDIGAPKQRAVLAMLLIDANRVVPVDRLIDRLWGDDPPARAMGSLQAYVSNLRRVLEPGRAPRESGGRIATRPPGYVLAVAADESDAASFETTASAARARAVRGEHAGALAEFDQCLALWRGPAYLEFADEPFAIAECSRLEEL